MPFVVILARGIQVSKLGCYGAAWSLTPNFDRIASQSLVFDHFLRENTQPQLWGAGLATRTNSWCWSGAPPTFSAQCKSLHLVDPPPNHAWIYSEWLKNIWMKSAETQADLLVIELLDAVPPWKPELEDLEAYFPGKVVGKLIDANGSNEKNPKDSLDGPDSQMNEDGLAPWLRPLPSESLEFNHPQVMRESLLLTHGAAIASLDKKLGTVLDFLAEHQTSDTHILVTSDAGIALGEKGLYGHHVSVPWLDTSNVPLIWCHPTREANSLRHSALVSDRDLNELLFGKSQKTDGLLESCWDAPREKGSPFVVTHGLNQSRACRTKDWSLVVEPCGAARLFEFPLDHWEMNDLGTRHPNELQWMVNQSRTASDQPGGQPS